MGGGATRFMTLLTTPFPPLRPSSLHLLHRRFSHPPPPLHPPITHSSSPKLKIIPSPPHHLLTCSFHSHPTPNNNNNNSTTSSYSLTSHPWPEWTTFLNSLSSPNHISLHPDDAFVLYERLPDHFVRAAIASLSFSRSRPHLIRSLSRKDIELLVSTGTPFLFRGAVDIARRMQAFLASDDAAEVEKASAVDLMKYILSYASNPTVSSEGSRNGLYNKELVHSSVRNLLRELVTVSSGDPAGYVPDAASRFSGRPRQNDGAPGKNIEMKRGDWACTKCNFMNFARNVNCRECNELRPRKQLTGGEWECPQCNFCNYGANPACLRCDCRRAGASSESQNLHSSSEIDKEKELAGKSKIWFQKIAEMHDVKDLSGTVKDEDFPEIMPMRKGENRFVVSKQKDRSLTTPKFKRQVAMDQSNNTNFVPFVPFPPGYFAKKDEQPRVPDSSVKAEPTRLDVSSKDDKSVSPVDTSTGLRNDYQPTTSSNSHVQMSSASDNIQSHIETPTSYGKESTSNNTSNIRSSPQLPENKSFQGSWADASKGPRNDYQPTISDSIQNDIETPASYRILSAYNNSNIGSSSQLPQNESFRSSWVGPSLEGSAVKETDPLDMSEEAKTERWFKRVAQIKDISELSQIPDEDFPSIMPMRKGVNRFVVSKRKTPLERRLTNQQYRRNLPIVTTDPLNSKEGK